jgi:hypothetical protein
MSSIVAYSLECVYLAMGYLPRICLRGKVFIEPFSSSGSICHNIKMDLRELGWGGTGWIDLAQGREQWRAHMNMVMNLRVP